MPAVSREVPSSPVPYLLSVVLLGLTAVVLLAMGRTPWCTCGSIRLWHGIVASSENSQHVSDWYSFSHVIHGFIFYGGTWLIGRRWPLGMRLLLATAIEGGWEILENTDFIINRYREATISLDYYGDSVLNSVCDILFMVLGFFLAARLPVLVTVGIALALELFVGYAIRDNLTLNVIMLLYPLDVVRQWQAGG